jgi:hypothetical protein
MTRSAILDEVRAIREAIAQEHDYDVAAIFQMLKQMEMNSERTHVDLSSTSTTTTPRTAQQVIGADEGAPRR